MSGKFSVEVSQEVTVRCELGRGQRKALQGWQSNMSSSQGWQLKLAAVGH